MPLLRSYRGTRAFFSLRHLAIAAAVVVVATLPIADHQVPESPSADSETNSAPVSGRVVTLDEVTGELRAPTPKEFDDLYRNSTRYKTTDLPPVEHLPDGSRRQRLNRQVRSASYARIEAGELITDCGKVPQASDRGDLR